MIATFSNKATILKGPAFFESIQTDDEFLNINKRMNGKCWYNIDSRSIMNNKDKLTKYILYKKLLNYKKKKIKKNLKVVHLH